MSDRQPGTVYAAPRAWTRMHPVSPFLGSGPVLGFIALYWLARLAPSWVAGDAGENEALENVPAPLIGVGALAVIAAIVGVGWASWRRNEYRIGDDAMYHRKGILVRQHRQARLDRIEAVDVVQPLLARLFGLARLDVQVAGGKGSGIDLSYLRLGDAEALRNEVLALASSAKGGADAVAGAAADGDHSVGPDTRAGHTAAPAWAVTLGETHPVTAVPAAPERDLLTVPTGMLLGSVALSTPTLIVAIALVLVVAAAIVFGSVVGAAIAATIGTSLFAIVGFVAGTLSYFWNRINGGWQFTVSTSTDGLRLRHGLLETRRQTVKPGRVQAVLVRQPWLWRSRGWYQVTMNVAGYQDEQERVSTLLPVGSLADVQLVLELVVPEASGEVLARAVAGRGGADGFTPSPRRAWLMDPLQWRYRGVRAGEHALAIRSGWLTRDVVMVPHARTQSLGVRQRILQRWLGLASFRVHSTPGRVQPVAANMDVEEALLLLEQQAARARAAIRG